ncbi:hypothetical protein [Candidatus Mycoplasma pogonae]
MRKRNVLKYFQFAKTTKSVNPVILEGCFVSPKLFWLQFLSSLILIISVVSVLATTNFRISSDLFINNNLNLGSFKTAHFNLAILILAIPSLITAIYCSAFILIASRFIPKELFKYTKIEYQDYDFFIENLKKGNEPDLVYYAKYKKID